MFKRPAPKLPDCQWCKPGQPPGPHNGPGGHLNVSRATVIGTPAKLPKWDPVLGFDVRRAAKLGLVAA
jgi:hypothetical protein